MTCGRIFIIHLLSQTDKAIHVDLLKGTLLKGLDIHTVAIASELSSWAHKFCVAFTGEAHAVACKNITRYFKANQTTRCTREACDICVDFSTNEMINNLWRYPATEYATKLLNQPIKSDWRFRIWDGTIFFKPNCVLLFSKVFSYP